MTENLNLQTVESVDTRPFRKLIMTIGELPTSFVESMTYYELLAWFTNYLETVIIPTVNNNAEAVEELQQNYVELKADTEDEIDDFETRLNTAFTTLQNFVDNYFDNLDVQDEINNKLDEMASDGTLASLISTQILGDLSTLLTNDKSTIVDAVNEVFRDQGIMKMDYYRKKYYSHWDPVTLPSDINNSFFDNFKFYTNGAKDYYVDFDRNNFINTSAHTYYVATNGNNSTGDGTENNPYLTIYEAYKHCSAGDTIYVKNGIYPRQGTPSSNSTEITKSINIIGESENGVWFKEADNHTWTQNSTYSNVYETSRTGVTEVVDIQQKDKGIFFNLTQVYSLENCASTDNSYYTDSGVVYVNQCGIVVSDATIVVGLGLSSEGLFRCQDFTGDSLIYMKNINILESNCGGFNCNNNTNHTVTAYLDTCKFYNNYAGTYALDSMTSRGCFTICENVICNNTKKDGFNYHDSSTNIPAIGIEINCTSINCGYGQTGSGYLSNNATTAHQNAQVVRVNGTYGFCNGGCAVDIDTVKSAFYNCTIFDSYGRNYDLYAAGTAVIYVIDCYFKGSKAAENLKSTDTSHVYYNDGTEFDTKAGANVLPIE